MFAGVHLVDPGAVYALPGLFLIGIALGWFALATGDLSLSIAVHAGVNLTGVLLITFGEDLTGDQPARRSACWAERPGSGIGSRDCRAPGSCHPAVVHLPVGGTPEGRTEETAMAGSSTEHIDDCRSRRGSGEGSPGPVRAVGTAAGAVSPIGGLRMAGRWPPSGAVVAGWLWWGQPPTVGDPAESRGAAVVASPTGDPPVTVAATTIMVHVSGAVLHPGLVSVAPGARVADAIAAAGGASRSADVAGSQPGGARGGR